MRRYDDWLSNRRCAGDGNTLGGPRHAGLIVLQSLQALVNVQQGPQERCSIAAQAAYAAVKGSQITPISSTLSTADKSSPRVCMEECRISYPKPKPWISKHRYPITFPVNARPTLTDQRGLSKKPKHQTAVIPQDAALRRPHEELLANYVGFPSWVSLPRIQTSATAGLILPSPSLAMIAAEPA